MPVTHEANGSCPPSASHPPPPARVKQSRAHSPSDRQATEPRPPPAKRARKAINCEPCRNSKLKCDRNRPCSSCVLRGTSALCYQGQESDPSLRGEDQQQTRVDPAAEFSRIRHSLSLLESHVNQNASLHGLPIASSSSSSARRASSPGPQPFHDYTRDSAEADQGFAPRDVKASNLTSTPGMLGQQGSGGFYAGPTSALSHLITASERDDAEAGDGRSSTGRGGGRSPTLSTGTPSIVSPSMHEYDEDLVALLPPLHIIDGLIEYYFEYCNWIYRTVNQPALLAGWGRFKNGQSGDRIVFGTVCILMALAMRYLPPAHALLATLPGTCEELGVKYYGLMLEALKRHQQSTRKGGQGKGYTLELVELLLVRCHYLTFAKEDPEETWSVRGELMSIGTAMGLHRDPGKARFDKFEAERRRWAWWHIILLERWQAFMFGRPLSISSHHFNTRLPSYCDPALDKTGRLYLPNIALFRLAYVLGDIMDDAVSFRPVTYASVQDKDKLLTQWMDDLPSELDLDEYRIARSLASPVTSVRRLGVQSVIIRTAYHHIRFTLHRPYAKNPVSLETAVSAAGQLIALVGQTRPDFLSNTALAVPGHMNWGPFHVFSAAMFFSFQLISHPDQPAASLFRENIRKAIASLEQSKWMPVADKALTILQALAPLYSDELASENPEGRERKKAQVLNLVRTLAFPYQDSTYLRSAESPTLRRDSTITASSSTPPNPQSVYDSPTPSSSQTQTQLPVSSVRWTGPSHSELSGMASYPNPPPIHTLQMPAMPVQQHMHSHNSPVAPSPGSGFSGVPHYDTQGTAVHPHMVPGRMDGHALNGTHYLLPADESSMWGASIGFGMGEWAQFLDAMQPDSRGRGP